MLEPQQRHERDGEEQVRQRELRLHRAHDPPRVDSAAGPAADQAERDADGGGQQDGAQRQAAATCARRRPTRLRTSRPSGSVPSGLAPRLPPPGGRLEREGQVLVVVAARGDEIREGGDQERDHEDRRGRRRRGQPGGLGPPGRAA